MNKFVYLEFEIKGMNGKPMIASKGYFNTDYIVSIRKPFKYREIEMHTGCIDDLGIRAGTKTFVLTKRTFDNLLKELGIKDMSEVIDE